MNYKNRFYSLIKNFLQNVIDVTLSGFVNCRHKFNCPLLINQIIVRIIKDFKLNQNTS